MSDLVEWRFLIKSGAATVRAAHWEVNERGALIFYDAAHVPIEAVEPGEWKHVEEWSRPSKESKDA